jgi:hypothetical protein
LQLLDDPSLGQTIEHCTVSSRLFGMPGTRVMGFTQRIGNESGLHKKTV